LHLFNSLAKKKKFLDKKILEGAFAPPPHTPSQVTPKKILEGAFAPPPHSCPSYAYGYEGFR